MTNPNSTTSELRAMILQGRDIKNLSARSFAMVETAHAQITHLIQRERDKARIDEVKRASKVNVWWKEYARERIKQLQASPGEASQDHKETDYDKRARYDVGDVG